MGDQLARSFGRAVEDYERGRPEWPPEPLDHVVDALALRTASTVVDLAAGTGKLTRLLAARFQRVVAIEPDDDMRAFLARRVPNAEPLAGTAERVPLADALADCVFVAEAFHWFDGGRALAEIARVLRPEGGLVLVWNRPQEDLLPRGFGADPRQPAQRYPSGIWREAFADSPFEPLQEARFEHVQHIDRDGVLAYFASVSPIASLPDGERARRLEEIAEQLVDESYARRWRTDVYWTRLRQ